MGRLLTISTANSAKALRWKSRAFTWEELTECLLDVRRTAETVAEYDAMKKAERNAVKDGPSYVAGKLKGGRRRKDSVAFRSCVVLDADQSDPELMSDWEMLIGDAALLYPTHSSRPSNLKHRLVVPLSRDVTPDEYVPLSMKLAQTLGLDRFDPTTYQPERLMFFPSASADADWEPRICEGDLLDPDYWLATYEDWTDAAEWPVQPQGVERRVAKAPDPRNKRGAVGAFCRALTIEEAIEAYLGEVYIATEREDRYTYAEGSTVGGVVCYSGLWAYSNHATDPAGGQLMNAFDLVRIHRFGDMDRDSEEDTPVTALPSYTAMCEWAQAEEPVAVELARGAAKSAAAEFAEEAVESAQDEEQEPDDAWKARLDVNAKTGAIEPSASNLLLILEKDERLAGKLRRDVESRAVWVVADRLPWRKIPKGADLWSDEDDSSLRLYIETRYGIVAKGKIDDAVSHEATRRPYDPLREHLDALPEWDGIPRVDTLLIDMLGAEDSAYTREATRKTLVGAIKRAYEPGCKWDYMLILEGAQGLGKSTFWELLAGPLFFSDSLTLKDIEYPKVAGEKIRGSWIVEVAELDGMAKTSIERLKGWLSTKADTYRAAYARHAAVYKRRCVVVGTVNNLDGYLRDATGNRRFWPVRVERRLDRSRMDADYIAQVWAEAKALEKAGEPLYLSRDVEPQAELRQREAMETDPREGLVRAYLEAPVPESFDTWALSDREEFWSVREDFEGAETTGEPRSEISIMEIWHEALKQPKERPTRNDSYQIAAMLRKLGWKPTGVTKRSKAYGIVKTYGVGDNV